MENSRYKFRVWNKKNNILSIATTLHNLNYADSDEHKNIWTGGYGLIQWTNAIIMQFTGLFDKNGKEIYEGDIITDGFGRNYEIIFKKGCFGFEVINPINKISMNFANFTNINQEDVYYEVIGNIFENQGLLK